jgi:hypothetical protein
MREKPEGRRRRYQRRRAEGLCVRCGKDAKPLAKDAKVPALCFMCRLVEAGKGTRRRAKAREQARKVAA